MLKEMSHAGWRDQLRKVRQLGREAEKAGGTYRRNLLIQASRILVQLLLRAEPRGLEEKLAFQRELLDVENWIHDMAQECLGCLSEQEIPEG